ncbi:MAG: C4-dicarboxylate ABC transporter [Blastopirellula sp.]|nr:MAG: C4-dicarboxylate ABC transporter [Blastopirellula sp.]
MNSDVKIKIPKNIRRSVVIILITIALVAIAALFITSLSYFRSIEIEEAKNRLSLYGRSLNGTLEQFQYLPSVLARYPIIISAHSAASNKLLNKQLAHFSKEAKLEAIYIMDRHGLVLASSNYDTPQTFVGQNYGFRPYFNSALSGKRGEFFGVGATTGRPGYFISEPVYDRLGNVSSIVAIKLDVRELQKAWEEGSERVFVSNKDGVIVLSSNPIWLYQTLSKLSDKQLADIRTKRQFGDKPLSAFSWDRIGISTVSIGGEKSIYVSTPAKRLGWRIHYLLSERRIFERATLTTFIFGGALSALLAFATFLRSTRIRAALRASQADRSQLRTTNTELKNAQAELARTSKLAALGQLSASVTHELGQPISAMRNYLAAAELDGKIKLGETWEKLNKVVDRMENITKQLRFFTKPGDEKLAIVSFQDVFGDVIALVEHDIRAVNVELETDICSSPVFVRGNRLRLEQVLVNLIKNALAAMEDTEDAVLSIVIRVENNLALICVQDTGTGFGDRKLEQLQEPFHTTRASGDGMGLGLSISAAIIKEHDGELIAQNLENGGARFSVSLPLSNGRA